MPFAQLNKQFINIEYRLVLKKRQFLIKMGSEDAFTD
jgi:hypothetical protein